SSEFLTRYTRLTVRHTSLAMPESIRNRADGNSSSGSSSSGHSNRGTRVTAATLAVVDLGSNSFRLEIGRVEGGQIYRQDPGRETLRFGAGLDSDGRIKPAAMKAAIECLQRFRE